MHLLCETCGTVFSVTVHCGPEDSRLDWTNEPHRCFVCGGQAMEKDENNERESRDAVSLAETQSRVEEVLGMAQSHLDDWETGLKEGLYDDESGYNDARADLEAVRDLLEVAPELLADHKAIAELADFDESCGAADLGEALCRVADIARSAVDKVKEKGQPCSVRGTEARAAKPGVDVSPGEELAERINAILGAGFCSCERCDIPADLRGLVPVDAAPIQKDDETEAYSSDAEAALRASALFGCRAVAICEPDWGREQWYLLPKEA